MKKISKVQVVQPYGASCVFLQVQLRMDSSVPLLTLSTNYSEWKMKMITSLKRQDLYEVSIGLGEESYESENDWLNECDASLEQ